MSKKLQYQYMVVIEQAEISYGAYVPDLPGCVAVADTREEVLKLVREAVEFHLEDLRDRGEAIPPPCSSGEWIEAVA